MSPKTIRNEIGTINLFLKEKGISSVVLDKNGWCSCDMSLEEIKSALSPKDFYSYSLSKEERWSVTAVLLVLSSDFITLGTIANKLYVSRATIVNDMTEVRNLLHEQNLFVVSYSHKGFLVEGSESNRRLFLWKQYDRYPDLIKLIFDSSDDPFGASKINTIQKIVQEQENAHNQYLTDHSRHSLLRYLQIMMRRIHDGFAVENCVKRQTNYAKLSEDILKYMTQYCSIVFTHSEFCFLEMVLESLGYVQKRAIDQKILSTQIITRKFIENVSQQLRFDLNKDYCLFENLSSHISASRMESEIPEAKSILYEVTRKNDSVYQAVCDNQYLFESYFRRKLSDMEAVYITIHLCAAIERRQGRFVPLSVIIVCNEGVALSRLLEAKLSNLFRFKILSIIHSYEVSQLGVSAADLMISTVPLENSSLPTVVVSPMLNRRDLDRITQSVQELHSNRIAFSSDKTEGDAFSGKLDQCIARVLKQYDVAYADPLRRALCSGIMELLNQKKAPINQNHTPTLEELLTKDRIELDVKCQSWKEAVERSAKKLLEQGYIEPRYVDAIIQNIETYGPYMLISPGFAVPHADLDAGSIKAGMSLIRLKAPVLFDSGQPVQVLCCLSAVDNETHLEAFIDFVNLVENDEFKQALLLAPTPQRVMELIEEFKASL